MSERVRANVTVERVSHRDTIFGPRTYIVMRCDEGTPYLWAAVGRKFLIEGERFAMTGVFDGMDDYGGEVYQRVYRCTLSPVRAA